MKKLLFMPLMMLLTSCGEGGSFLRVNNSLGLASFIGVGLLVGACLGFIYAIMPRIDIITGTKITSCEKKTSCVIGGAVITACVAFLTGLCYFS